MDLAAVVLAHESVSELMDHDDQEDHQVEHDDLHERPALKDVERGEAGPGCFPAPDEDRVRTDHEGPEEDLEWT